MIGIRSEWWPAVTGWMGQRRLERTRWVRRCSSQERICHTSLPSPARRATRRRALWQVLTQDEGTRPSGWLSRASARTFSATHSSVTRYGELRQRVTMPAWRASVQSKLTIAYPISSASPALPTDSRVSFCFPNESESRDGRPFALILTPSRARLVSVIFGLGLACTAILIFAHGLCVRS